MVPDNKIPRPLTDEERNLLAQFARFDIRLDELLAKLDGMLELDFGSEQRRLTSHFLVSEPGIPIEKGHIRRAPEKRSAGEINDDDLFRWAIMILLNDAYLFEGRMNTTLQALCMKCPDQNGISEVICGQVSLHLA